MYRNTHTYIHIYNQVMLFLKVGRTFSFERIHAQFFPVWYSKKDKQTEKKREREIICFTYPFFIFFFLFYLSLLLLTFYLLIIA